MTSTTTSEVAQMTVFPGQGSQSAGMAAHLLRDHPTIAGPVFERVSATSGLNLVALCTTGSTEDLIRTEITQLAVLATSLATWEILQAHGYSPVAVAGHSLGEYSALVAARVLTAEAAAQIAGRRGELMARVANETDATMLAVLGLTAQQVEAACGERSGPEIVEVAGYNSPRQTVIAGHRAAILEITERLRAAGATGTRLLAVGAPFHCSLMRKIEDEFATELDRHEFADPGIDVLSSVSGQRIETGANAKSLLQEQLTRPVQWQKVLESAVDRHGRLGFIEAGPGKTLSGFIKHTCPPATEILTTGDEERLGEALRSFVALDRIHSSTEIDDCSS